ncbi:GNAT family N-acetyltransferase [Sebaldella sp. S0638]|uniref:GNAT family N-acetyltransferase n=1 Tax=Sebaldella sp. S0638 TaxID=2957809 RepID=UPI00209E9998|nr:GNAT family N-acetyltransferase [Sebaldella sp. S0638]MCP1224674.1 GNAT family N-acetyltransferase [Sebaldella sp. S0638]
MKIGYRIEIRKFTEEDFQEYFMLVSNADIMAMITGRALQREEAEKRFEKLLCGNKEHESFGSFMVFEKETGDFIGYGKMVLDIENKTEAETGYMLFPEYWGKGYATEITKLLMEKAEETAVLMKITAIIDPENTASRNVLLKNGFVSEKICDINGLPGEILGKKLK